MKLFHNKRFRGALIGVVILAGWCSYAEDLRTLARESREPLFLGTAISDDEIKERMIEFGTTLMKRKDSVRMKTLVRQLNRAQCELRLSEPRANRLSAEELIQQVRPSVLVVGSLYQCDDCKEWHLSTATGFALTEAGAFATCYHVVDQAEHSVMVVMTDDGRLFSVREVLAASKTHDVAILQLDGSGLTPLPIETNAPVGTPVFVVSHPSKNFYTFTAVMVSRYFVSEEEDEVKTTMMSITAEFGRGSSGCPVFNESGAVVGMAESILSTTSKGKNGEEKPSLVFKHARPTEAIFRLIISATQ